MTANSGPPGDESALGPLVYLDQAGFVLLADRKLDPKSERALRDAIDDSHSSIVVSPAHLLDAGRSPDLASRDRVLQAMSSFPIVYVMTETPSADEALELDAAFDSPGYVHTRGPLRPRFGGLRFFGAGSSIEHLRGLVKVTEVLGPIAQQLSVAANLAKGARRNVPMTPAMAAGQAEALLRLANPETRGALVDEIWNLPGPHSKANGFPRVAVAAALEAAGSRLVAEMEATGGSIEHCAANYRKHPGSLHIGNKWLGRKRGVEDWLAAAKEVAPGRYARVVLEMSIASNVTRTDLPSDLGDLEHVKLIPYMDVATVDAFTFGALRDKLPMVLGHPVLLSRNADWEGLIANIKAPRLREPYSMRAWRAGSDEVPTDEVTLS